MASPNPPDEFDALLKPQAAAPQAAIVAAPQGNVDAEFDALAKAPPEAAPEPFSWTKFFKEQGNELVRSGAKAAYALPGMAADFVTGGANLASGLTGNGYDRFGYPSAAFNQVLDQYTTPPTSTAGKIGEFAASTLLGSRIPAPKYAPSALPGGGPVPANFAPPVTQAQQNLAQARQAGYVFPPSTIRPTIPNKLVEALGSKAGTAQDAAVDNMPVTNSLVRKALGMAPDAEITPEALAKIRATAGDAKAAVVNESGPVVNLDAAHRQGISQILQPYKEAAAELGDRFGNPELVKAGEAINKGQITPKVAMRAVEGLRSDADQAFRAADKPTGIAYKALATNLEDAIDRHLVGLGKSDVVDKYRAARTLQAQTYDVEKALNPATNNVNAQILKRADYLTGPLKTVANAAGISKDATKEILHSGSVSNTDVITGGLAAVLQKDPKFLVYPLARQAVRAGMLSQRGQNAMIGKPRGLFTPPQPPSMSGMPQSLFGQLNLANQ